MSSATLDQPNTFTTAAEHADFVKTLKNETAPVRVMRERFGLRKALSADQRAKAAQPFHADGSAISSSKKLLDTKHPAMREISRIMGEAIAYWRFCTVPYPENGVRLIRRAQIPAFEEQMHKFRDALQKAVATLNEALDELKSQAREALGDLYNPTDYPDSIRYRISWDYPVIAVPEYLKQLNPALYEREQERLNAKLTEAVAMHEKALVEELDKMVAGLLEKLTATAEDGRSKAIRAVAVENFEEFFQRVDNLGVESPELADVVARAKEALHGVGIDQLRENVETRASIADRLKVVSEALETQIVERNRLVSFEDEGEAY